MSAGLRYTAQFLSLALLLGMSAGAKASAVIETVNDMRVLKQQAESSDLPVLLLFTAEECIYCEAIKSNFLGPMNQSGEYASKILIRQLYIDDYTYIRNEKGELINADQIAMKYDVAVTPTIVFIDANGKELTERVVGITSIDYFDQLLSARISQAQKVVTASH